MFLSRVVLSLGLMAASLSGTEACCNDLVFESSGSLGSGSNNHIIGHYVIYSDGVDGRTNYLQTDNYFGDMYLYWYPQLSVRRDFFCAKIIV